MKRRTFLVGAGSVVLGAAGGIAGFAATRTPQAALEPWRLAGLTTGEARTFVLEHAVLAPNPHNRQPWLVELLDDGDMLLFCDLERRLPETDPFDRQITIGLGAFIELAAIAASRIGYRLEILPFPDGEPAPRLDHRPIARLRLVKSDKPADPLYAQILARRSTKRPFDMTRQVPDEAAMRLTALSGPGVAVSVVRDAAMVGNVRDLTWRAWTIEAATERTHMESVRLMRIGRREIEANPDGISLGGPFLEALSLVGSLTRETLADPNSSATVQAHQMYRTMLTATGAYLLVTAADGSRAGALSAGRTYVRANLSSQAMGLSMHPVSQALQEFPEMAETRRALDSVLSIESPARLHMLARLGYGPAVPPTPRWRAGTRIRRHDTKPA